MLILDEFSAGQAACSYLPDRPSQHAYLVAGQMDSAEYIELLARYYRRSGRAFYRPACHACGECVPYRVLVEQFRRTRSQARAWRRNQDLEVRVVAPEFDALHVALYNRYVTSKHAGADVAGALDYWAFLVDSPLPTLEFQYWSGANLVAVGIVDDLGTAGSSVYFFYDPRESTRSLGVYSMLVELAWAKSRGYAHHYLGYWIRGARTMSYKDRYRPAEVLVEEGRWARLEEISR